MTIRFLPLLFFCAVSFTAFAETPDKVGGGRPVTTVEVPVLARDVARGDTIVDADIVYQAVPVVRAAADVARDATDLSGKAARRFLRAGELVRVSDVKLPTLVAKGDMVTMLFDAPGIVLTSTGRAMVEGGAGETIVVLNPVSHRQIEAVVIGAGKVRVGSVTNDITRPLASANP